MKSRQDSVVVWSQRLYDALLWLYPGAYRHTYGPLMTQLFLDQLRDAQHQGMWHVMTL